MTVKKATAVSIIVTLLAVLSGNYVIENNSDTFYCSTEDSVKECVRVSGSRCYEDTGWDTCVGGKWEPIELFLNQNKEKENVDNEQENVFFDEKLDCYLAYCPTEGCHVALNKC